MGDIEELSNTLFDTVNSRVAHDSREIGRRINAEDQASAGRFFPCASAGDYLPVLCHADATQPARIIVLTVSLSRYTTRNGAY